MAVALKRYNVELVRNGVETETFDKNRRFPQFFSFLAKLNNFKLLKELSLSQMIQNCLIWARKDNNKLQQEVAVFRKSDGSTAVSSQFHIIPL